MNIKKISAMLFITVFIWLLSGCGIVLPEPAETTEITDSNIKLGVLSGGKEDKEVPDIYRISLVHPDGAKEEFLADHMRYRSYGVELHLIEQEGNSVDKNIIMSLGSDYLIEKLKKDRLKIKVEA